MADPDRRYVVSVIAVCLAAAVAIRSGAPQFPVTVALLLTVLAFFLLWSKRGPRG